MIWSYNNDSNYGVLMETIVTMMCFVGVKVTSYDQHKNLFCLWVAFLSIVETQRELLTRCKKQHWTRENPFTDSVGVMNVDLRRSGPVLWPHCRTVALLCNEDVHLGKPLLSCHTAHRQGPAWHLVSRGLAEPISSVKQRERKFVSCNPRL